MVQLGSFVFVSDKSAISLAKCIKVLGPGRNNLAYLGDVILIVVKEMRPDYALLRRKKRKYNVGQIHRALIIRSNWNTRRNNGFHIRFFENSGIIVNRNRVPLTNRIFGPVLREFCVKYPSIGCLSKVII